MSVLGHRMAYESGVVPDVSPYLGALTILTTQQIGETLLARCARRSGHLLVLPRANTFNGFYLAVCKAGFSFIGSFEVDFETEAGKPSGLTLWSAPVPGLLTPRPCRSVCRSDSAHGRRHARRSSRVSAHPRRHTVNVEARCWRTPAGSRSGARAHLHREPCRSKM